MIRKKKFIIGVDLGGTKISDPVIDHGDVVRHEAADYTCVCEGATSLMCRASMAAFTRGSQSARVSSSHAYPQCA